MKNVKQMLSKKEYIPLSEIKSIKNLIESKKIITIIVIIIIIKLMLNYLIMN